MQGGVSLMCFHMILPLLVISLLCRCLGLYVGTMTQKRHFYSPYYIYISLSGRKKVGVMPKSEIYS